MKHVPVLSILKFPDPRLELVAEPVDQVDREECEQLSAKMLDVMVLKRGFGLAAPQVAVPWRMFVMQIPKRMSALWPDNISAGLPFVFVNPVIVRSSESTVVLNEGCLSFPGVHNELRRPAEVAVKWTDVHDWSEERAIFNGWEARCIQHEIEHLDGKLLIDHLLPAAQKKVRRRAQAGRRL